MINLIHRNRNKLRRENDAVHLEEKKEMKTERDFSQEMKYLLSNLYHALAVDFR